MNWRMESEGFDVNPAVVRESANTANSVRGARDSVGIPESPEADSANTARDSQSRTQDNSPLSETSDAGVASPELAPGYLSHNSHNE